jgi:hypothetical protein
MTGPSAASGPSPSIDATPARRLAAVSVRILAIDHYQTRPDERFEGDAVHAEFSPPGTPLRHVPVIRVYGLTTAGQKCLVHVHNVGLRDKSGQFDRTRF